VAVGVEAIAWFDFEAVEYELAVEAHEGFLPGAAQAKIPKLAFEFGRNIEPKSTALCEGVWGKASSPNGGPGGRSPRRESRGQALWPGVWGRESPAASTAEADPNP
jgi:hypothetical protein